MDRRIRVVKFWNFWEPRETLENGPFLGSVPNEAIYLYSLIPNPCSSQLYLQQMLLQCDCNGFGTIGGTELLEYRHNVLLCGVR